MAAQITHIVLAHKIFDTFFINRKKKEFFIGTCFPDIRYLRVIERENTHLSDIFIRRADSDFLAGVKFHAIVDKLREKYIVENGTYSLCPISAQTKRSLKLLEDRLGYDSLSNWPEYIDFFDEILPDEIAFGVNEENLRRWHTILKTYFNERPTETTTTQFVLSLGLTIEAADEIRKVMLELSANQKIISILKNLYENFDTILGETEKYIVP